MGDTNPADESRQAERESARPHGDPRAEPADSTGEMPRAMFYLLLFIALLGALGGGFAIARALTEQPKERVVEVRVGAPVLESVRELARLETVSFHMERVVELKDEQRPAFGLLKAEDAILLVAAADVSAGVDLKGLKAEDVEVDREARRVKLRLPAASVFDVTLDEEHTYVHSRTTDLLAKRKLDLEGQARRLAVQDLEQAAKKAGILKRAQSGAQRTLESLLRSLGYEQIEIEFAEAAP
ncbi:MAG: DUF4230 domain-containing protein [Myxococcales bacterium]|nr:DUF4230 domain-containing protein [Myxococcales bacterium]